MTPEDIAPVLSAVQSGSPLAALRQQFAQWHFTACGEDDVPPQYRSVGETGAQLLFLVSGQSGHCLTLTNDLAAASGFVVAERSIGD